MAEEMILAEGCKYSMDCYKTHLNNNVIVVGASGAGKTRSIVIPNIMEATGSYVISDPKGNLYRKLAPYLRDKGYKVKKVDFTDPKNSCKYNFFEYIRSTQDIVKVSNILMNSKSGYRDCDLFWPEAAKLLLQTCIAYLMENTDKDELVLHNVFKMLGMIDITGNLNDEESLFDMLFEQAREKHGESFAYNSYKKFRVAASNTLRSIIIELNAMVGIYDTPEIERMTEKDEVRFGDIGNKKTAVFVVVSDTDRSMDGLVNVFFTQAMNELCYVADKQTKDNRLKVPVRFIMDDFATNCKIEEFPRMISSIRSRNISAMILIQSEGQLEHSYDQYDAKTIIANCDTYVYMGGNDVSTAKAIAERSDIPAKKILTLPIGTNLIFRRGNEMIRAQNYDLEKHEKEYRIRCEKRCR